jgi:F0F1-type ATP synthase alpha subunit
MKQKQYSPQSVAEMGIVLYAANEGFLDDVPVNKVVDFEAAMLSYMNAEQADLVAKINVKGDYNDDIASGIKAALETFKSTQTW